jgi:hypothetical protein
MRQYGTPIQFPKLAHCYLFFHYGVSDFKINTFIIGVDFKSVNPCKPVDASFSIT